MIPHLISWTYILVIKLHRLVNMTGMEHPRQPVPATLRALQSGTITGKQSKQWSVTSVTGGVFLGGSHSCRSRSWGVVAKSCATWESGKMLLLWNILSADKRIRTDSYWRYVLFTRNLCNVSGFFSTFSGIKCHKAVEMGCVLGIQHRGGLATWIKASSFGWAQIHSCQSCKSC